MAWSPKPSLEDSEPQLGWSDEARHPDRTPEVGWTGIKKVQVPTMQATASMEAPKATSGATVKVPGEGTLTLPFTLPGILGSRPQMHARAELPRHELARKVGAPTIRVTGVMFPPTVTVSKDITVHVPPMIGTLKMPKPTVTSGATVRPPVMRARTTKDRLPYRLPWVLGREGMMPPEVSATKEAHTAEPMTAKATMFAPTVTSGATVNAPTMRAPAAVLPPKPSTSYTVHAPTMRADADKKDPAVASGASVEAPTMYASKATMKGTTVAAGTHVAAGVIFQASAKMLDPTVTSGATVDVPTMRAESSTNPTRVDVSDAPPAEPTTMGATAHMLSPSVTVGHTVYAPPMRSTGHMPQATPSSGATVHPPVMRADAVGRKLPLTLPFELGGRPGMPKTGVSTWRDKVSPDPLSASAKLLTPKVSKSATVLVPTMRASAALLTPTTTSGATVSPPLMTAKGTLHEATKAPLPMQPVTRIFPTPGTFVYDIPADARFIEYLMIGGGKKGKNGGAAFNAGEGGEAGRWYIGVFVRGLDLPWTVTQIAVTVGAGGAAGSGNGGDSSVTVAGMTRVALGATSLLPSGQNGQTAQNRTLSGILYEGGAGGTGNGGAGAAPGGGGAGGNGGLISGSNGGPGGAGRVWFRAYN